MKTHRPPAEKRWGRRVSACPEAASGNIFVCKAKPNLGRRVFLSRAHFLCCVALEVRVTPNAAAESSSLRAGSWRQRGKGPGVPQPGGCHQGIRRREAPGGEQGQSTGRSSSCGEYSCSRGVVSFLHQVPLGNTGQCGLIRRDSTARWCFRITCSRNPAGPVSPHHSV